MNIATRSYRSGIRFIVGLSAGGGYDVYSRTIDLNRITITVERFRGDGPCFLEIKVAGPTLVKEVSPAERREIEKRNG